MVSASLTDFPANHPIPTVTRLRLALSEYALESQAPFLSLRQGPRDLVRQINSDAPKLEQELKGIQQRLGTPQEKPGDMKRGAEIGHLLTNMMCLALLVREVNKD
jgi:hypothetical protein